jgi:hypothetical protein
VFLSSRTNRATYCAFPRRSMPCCACSKQRWALRNAGGRSGVCRRAGQSGAVCMRVHVRARV